MTARERQLAGTPTTAELAAQLAELAAEFVLLRQLVAELAAQRVDELDRRRRAA
jgi:hypothetical protein